MKIFLSAAAAAAMAALACYSLLDSVKPSAVLDYSDGGFVYTGPLLGGLFDGRGDVAFADGARLSGEFRKGRAAAVTYTPVDGWRFEGSFSGGKPAGTFFLPDDAAAGLSPGDIAAFASPKGWAYEGGVGERGQNGEGKYVFPGGESYTGGFLLGLAEGQGTYRDKAGSVVYEGQWKAGLYHGQGKYTQPGGAFTYEGAFEAGLPHGRAKYSEAGALRYDGDFAGGVPQGQGIYYSPEGWVYEGGFMNGVFHGKGTLTRDGTPAAGEWAKGVRVGGEQ